MRKKFLILFVYFVIGAVIFHNSSYYLLSAALPALFLIYFLKKQKLMTLFCILFFLVGIYTSFLHNQVFQSRYNYLKSLKSFEGYVIEGNNNTFILKNYDRGYKISASSYNDLMVKPGDFIIINGEVREKPKYKENIMNSMGLDAYVTVKDTQIEKVEKHDLRIFPAKIKYKINLGLTEVDKEGGPFISGLILGYTNELEDTHKDNFKSLGIAHILAISGFNLGIIYYFITKLTKGLAARMRYIIVIATCFIYTLIGGFQPSIFRAFTMILIANMGKIFNRSYDILHSITLAAFIMLLFNTYYLYNPGFILSYIATAGIILLKNDINDKIPDRIKLIREELSIALSAFIATFPVVIWYSGYISIISILINMLISPLVSITTIMGFGAGFLYIVTGIKILLYPVVFIGVIFLKIVDFFEKFNIRWFAGQPALIFIPVYYIFILIVFGYIKVKIYPKINLYSKGILAVLCVILLLYHHNCLKIHVINVGQGDSIFIETPEGKSVLIDTGPEFSDYSALKNKVLPYVQRKGYNKIDLLLISHFHNDHSGGLNYLLNNFRVDSLAAYKDPGNYQREFMELSKDNFVKMGNTFINILYPPEGQDIDGDRNETCLVFELKYKNFSMLLTADAEEEVLENIPGEFDVFKVAHHGSKTSFNSKLIDKFKMTTAIISVGKNSFGHPSKEALEEFEKHQVDVFRTDRDGDISVITEGNGYKILFE